MKRIVLILFVVGIAQVLFAQNLDFLENNFGFREFKLRTPKENYAAYELKPLRDFYPSFDIVSVYVTKYNVKIGNTRTKEVHLFFVDNELLCVNAVLEDSLSLDYLKKSFGEGFDPKDPNQTDEDVYNEMKTDHSTMGFRSIWAWQTKAVRMEEEWIYELKNGKFKKQMVLSVYLIGLSREKKSENLH